MYEVRLEGLEVYGYHGVSQAERDVGHRFRVSIGVQVDGKADRTDLVEDTVDYSTLASIAAGALAGENFLTVERAAASIAEQVLSQFPLAQKVEVGLFKVNPPMALRAEAAGVLVQRSRR